MRKKDLESTGIRRAQSGIYVVALVSEIREGPREAVGRSHVLNLTPHDVATVLAALAAMPAYRDHFRAVADVVGESGLTEACVRKACALALK